MDLSLLRRRIRLPLTSPHFRSSKALLINSRPTLNLWTREYVCRSLCDLSIVFAGYFNKSFYYMLFSRQLYLINQFLFQIEIFMLAPAGVILGLILSLLAF